jgi:hypothetical protein
MRYWIREAAGWLLVAVSLYIFYLCYHLLLGHYVVETGALTVIGIFLFRGGIHVLKIAVAAQVCLQAQEQLRQESAAGKKKPATPSATPRLRLQPLRLPPK